MADPPEDSTGGDVIDMPKRRGRPKGSGRAKGTPNNTTQALRRKIHRRGKPVEAICDVAAGKVEIEGLPQADALRMLFRAVVPELRGEIVSGPDDGPIETRATQILEASERVAAAFTEVAGQPDPGERLTDESLGAVQSLNFLLAQREAAERAKAPAHTSTPTVADAVPEATSPPPESTLEPETPQGEPEAPPEGHTLAFVEGTLCIVGCPPDRDGLPPICEVRTNGGSMVKRGPFNIALELVRKHSGGDLGRWELREPRPELGFSRPDQHAVRQPVRPAVSRRRSSA